MSPFASFKFLLTATYYSYDSFVKILYNAKSSHFSGEIYSQHKSDKINKFLYKQENCGRHLSQFFYAQITYVRINIYILIHTSVEILTSCPPCYIISRVIKEAYMSKRVKVLIAILCIILALMSLLSFFVASMSAFHICRRSSCPICRFMDMVSDMQKSLHLRSKAVLLILLVLVYIKSLTSITRVSSSKTPVELMVRMNDQKIYNKKIRK